MGRKLHLRLTAEDIRVLAVAAAAERRSVSEFALERAAEALADRRRFELDAEQWVAFQAALDTPPREMPRLRRLLDQPGPFSCGEAE